MTSIVSSTFNPRSYIYSSNSETLILQSATSEARLSFINNSYATGDFRYLMSASAQQLTVGSIYNNVSTQIQTFSTVSGVPNVETFGSVVSSNIRFSPTAPNNSKLIILQDTNPSSSTQFAGFGINTSTQAIEYYVPGYNIISHIFYSGLTSTTSTPLMNIQANPTSGKAQVGIGIVPGTPISQTTSLVLENDIEVGGNLIVQNINLNPNNIVNLDPLTQRIASNIMPTGLVFTSGPSNLIDSSLVPKTITGSYFKTYKNFGIGTRNPVQQLQVQGSTYITERLGVGIAYPAHRLHVVESAAGIPTAALYNTAGGDVLQTYISSNTLAGPINVPVLTIVGSHCAVGIGTTLVNRANSLQIVGNTDTTSLSVKNVVISNSISGSISTLNLNNINTSKSIINYTSSNNLLNINAPTSFSSNCSIYGNLTSYGNTTVYSPINTLSDERTKYNIVPIANSLTKINSINGYTYSLYREKNTPNQNNRYAGILAQEIQYILPEAVSYGENGFMGVKYDSLIPLLIQSIKELTSQVTGLTSKVVELETLINNN